MTQCPVCYAYHEPKDWHVWPIYDKPVYWSLPDDGAPLHCSDCREAHSHKDVYLTQLTCGSRTVICKDCIDETWLANAVNKGQFKI